MTDNGSATRPTSRPIPAPPAVPAAGLAWGALGVAAFSLTVPLTRVAVGGLSPLLIGAGRAVVAALLAAAALGLARAARPVGRQWTRLAVVAGGVVVGFPLLTTYALTTVPASHGAVVIALLPAATAVVAVLRTGESPTPRFWAFSAAGAVAAVGFATAGGTGGGLHVADLLLLGAVLAAAVGYAEGGLLSRELGSWQTVSWALLVAAPLMVVLTAVAVVRRPPEGSPAEWAAFGYLAAVSMFLGFFAWYRGLAFGPMAQVSQVQLVQPVLSLLWAALLLGEAVGWRTGLGAVAVIACAAGAVRSPLRST
ncbi:DMT family transporter [Nocardioides sp. IC4_145]|nr:DMT family transporter [Nocardioides sp. IC4_145]NHC24412.1 DMT family transporter [Nocardioides sp. IC4_145]